MDDEFLGNTLFPLTRRAYTFIFHFMEEGDDGRLHIRDTFSSEYGTAYDANEAIAMVRWGTGALLWMADRLNIADPDIPRWQKERASSASAWFSRLERGGPRKNRAGRPTLQQDLV